MFGKIVKQQCTSWSIILPSSSGKDSTQVTISQMVIAVVADDVLLQTLVICILSAHMTVEIEFSVDQERLLIHTAFRIVFLILVPDDFGQLYSFFEQ